MAGCRRSIIFVLIQVIHFMFIARNILLINDDVDDLMITVIAVLSFVFDKAQ